MTTNTESSQSKMSSAQIGELSNLKREAKTLTSAI